ncbi:MAG: glycosyltransferase [Vallitaleaceae bacterium]|nr:glycosyltransferase [Vallitaleaceae bacterium]
MRKIEDSTFKFSVLMSVYHKENPDYFKEALDSILSRQTLKPDEFILVVDGPVNEDLNMIIDEYEKKYVRILRVFRLENNIGLGKALNYGLDKCSYNLIARADSDDINAPERFQYQIDKFKVDDSIDVLGTFIDEFNNDYNYPINYKKMPLEHFKLYKMAKIRNPINHMTVMFKKNVIIEYGAYQHLPYLEDYYLWIRVMANGGKLENLDKYLVHARVGNGMVYRRSNKEYILSWKILNNYMKKEKIVNSIEYIRNIINIYGFIYMPVSFKKIVYRVLLRN